MRYPRFLFFDSSSTQNKQNEIIQSRSFPCINFWRYPYYHHITQTSKLHIRILGFYIQKMKIQNYFRYATIECLMKVIRPVKHKWSTIDCNKNNSRCSYVYIPFITNIYTFWDLLLPFPKMYSLLIYLYGIRYFQQYRKI